MKDLTKGFPAKVILYFAIPLMLGSVAQKVYNITDSRIVSLYVGSNALAAVGATGAITHMIIVFMNSLTQGFAIFTAKNYGAKNEEGMRRTVAGTVVLTALFTVLLTIMGVVFSRPILVALKTPQEILTNAVAYIRIILGGLVFTSVFNMCANLLRAIGDSKRPLYCIFFSIVVNIALDIIFTKNLHLGVKGAAYATIIAQALCAIACIVIMLSKAGNIIPGKKEMLLSVREYSELLNLGLSMAFMSCIIHIGSIILQSGINDLGIEAITAHTAGRRIFEILMVTIQSVGIAMTTFASQNYGAGQILRIKQGVKHALVVDTIITTVIVIFCFIFGKDLVSWVANSDNEIILQNGDVYLKLASSFFYTLGPLFIFRHTMQGLGAKFVPVLTGVMELSIKMLSVIILVPWLKFLGVAITEPISWFAMAVVLCIGYFAMMRKID